jgi:hypothetical protein
MKGVTYKKQSYGTQTKFQAFTQSHASDCGWAAAVHTSHRIQRPGDVPAAYLQRGLKKL